METIDIYSLKDKNLFDLKAILNNIDFEDEENERCYANQTFDKVLSDFCKRFDKLNEAE